MVKKWFTEFCSGRTSESDAHPSGRPVEVATLVSYPQNGGPVSLQKRPQPEHTDQTALETLGRICAEGQVSSVSQLSHDDSFW